MKRRLGWYGLVAGTLALGWLISPLGAAVKQFAYLSIAQTWSQPQKFAPASAVTVPGTTGAALYHEQDTNNPGAKHMLLQRINSAPGSIAHPLSLMSHTTSPGIGDGVGLSFELFDSAAAAQQIAQIDAVATNVTAGAHAGYLSFLTALAGAKTEKMRLDENGDLTVTAGAARENNADVYAQHRFRIVFPYNGDANVQKWAPHIHSDASNDSLRTSCASGACSPAEGCCDTTDCTQDPANVLTTYEAAGWDVLSLTDHDCASADPSVAGIIYIRGNEESQNQYHTLIQNTASNYVTTGGVTKDLFVKSSIDAGLADTTYASDGGPFVILAHAEWSTGATSSLYHRFKQYFGAVGIEIYNGGVDPDSDSTTIANQILSSQKIGSANRLFFVAVTDCHGNTSACTGAVTHANKTATYIYTASATGASTRAEVVKAIKRGALIAAHTGTAGTYFLPSAPPSLSGLTISITVGAAAECTWIGKDGATLETDSDAASGVPAQYTVVGDERYVYAKCTADAAPTTDFFWTSPAYIETVGGDVPNYGTDAWFNGTINMGEGSKFYSTTRASDGEPGFIFDTRNTIAGALDPLYQFKNGGTVKMEILSNGGLNLDPANIADTGMGSADKIFLGDSQRIYFSPRATGDYAWWVTSSLRLWDGDVEKARIGGGGNLGAGLVANGWEGLTDASQRLRSTSTSTTAAHWEFEVKSGTTVAAGSPLLQIENPVSTTVFQILGGGGFRAVGAAAQPTCAAAIRGTFWYTASASLTKDAVEVCTKDASDVYAWRVIY